MELSVEIGRSFHTLLDMDTNSIILASSELVYRQPAGQNEQIKDTASYHGILNTHSM